MLSCKGILVIEKTFRISQNPLLGLIDRADVDLGYCGKKIILNRKKLNKITDHSGKGYLLPHQF